MSEATEAGFGPGAGKSRHIRAPEDIADMVAWIADLSGKSCAVIVDEICRAEVERRYALVRHVVEAVKAAREGNAVFAPDLGGEGG